MKTERHYDKVFVNPTAAELAAALAEATNLANYRARERKVKAPNGAQVFGNEPEGVYWVDGGGVPVEYEWPAATSAVGYAWWTDKTGKTHVRVVGKRLRISGPQVPSPFLTEIPKSAVYPRGHEEITVLDILLPSDN